MKYHKNEEDWQERAYEEQEQCKHNDMESNQCKIEDVGPNDWVSISDHSGLWRITDIPVVTEDGKVLPQWKWVEDIAGQYNLRVASDTIVTRQAVDMRVDDVEHIPVWGAQKEEVPYEEEDWSNIKIDYEQRKIEKPSTVQTTGPSGVEEHQIPVYNSLEDIVKSLRFTSTTCDIVWPQPPGTLIPVDEAMKCIELVKNEINMWANKLDNTIKAGRYICCNPTE